MTMTPETFMHPHRFWKFAIHAKMAERLLLCRRDIASTNTIPQCTHDNLDPSGSVRVYAWCLEAMSSHHLQEEPNKYD